MDNIDRQTTQETLHVIIVQNFSKYIFYEFGVNCKRNSIFRWIRSKYDYLENLIHLLESRRNWQF